MMNVLNCVRYDHDLRLVAVSALICILGCVTTTMLLARVRDTSRARQRRWITSAAIIFGCSVWSLHFVAMIAFDPDQEMAYDLGLTIWSIVTACGGAMLALMTRYFFAGPMRIALSGLLLGLAIAGMHYIGVRAMTFTGFLMFDWTYVVASVSISVAFATLALARADRLDWLPRRLEVAGWLSLAICGLHFTGMAAITVVPDFDNASTGTVLGTATLAIVVGSVSVVILLASL
ncbi:MAG: bifunctional diguanylate cyclase/phosphodiesterase, partial [Proteobacteria bacterium]